MGAAKTFADLLVHYRRTAGLTQKQLAERAYLSLAAVSALERGVRRRPHTTTVTALTKALALTEPETAALTAAATPNRQPGTTSAPRSGVPRQLPAAEPDFTGREVELRQLVDGLGGAAVVAITGMAGAGKTTLAVQAAHAVEYPDGQVFVDLHGFGDVRPVGPLEALGAVLTALGAPETPLSTDQASAQLRTMLAARRVLLVLDNARDAAQVQPLLPGIGDSAVIVTSRGDLSLLPTTRTIRLGLWSEADGLAYLTKTVGARVTREPQAAKDVLEDCGHLPLAVRIAAARLISRPSWTFAHLHDLLKDRLDQLGVRASFAVSLAQLDDKARQAFEYFGLAAGPDLTVEVAARLFDRPERDTWQALEELCDLHLADSPEPGRYHLHDLLRAYAVERAPQDERPAALTRVLDLYTTVAWQALATSTPSATRLAWLSNPPAPSPDADTPAPRPEGFTWLDGQRQHLVAAITEAAENKHVPAHAILSLAIGLNSFYITRGHWLDWHRIITTALPFSTDDPSAEAFLRNDLGLVTHDLFLAGRADAEDAVHQLQLSLEQFQTLGQDAPAAMALTNLSHVLSLTHRHAEAVDCGNRAVAIYQRTNDSHGEALTHINLAQSYGGLGRSAEQRASYDRSIALATATSDERVLAEALIGSGTTYRAAGDLHRATAELTRAAEVSHAANDHLLRAEALDELGVTLHVAGRTKEAIVSFEQALEITAQYDDGFRREAVRRHLATASAAG